MYLQIIINKEEVNGQRIMGMSVNYLIDVFKEVMYCTNYFHLFNGFYVEAIKGNINLVCRDKVNVTY